MAGTPAVTVAIPTRDRPDYLDVTLSSVGPQAHSAGGEVLVVCDGPHPASAAVAERHGARVLTLPHPAGLNAARNAALDDATAPLVVFADDDVLAPPGWLDAYVQGGWRHPEVDLFGGPIRPLLEGGRLPTCGREAAPITALDEGPEDRAVDYVWGANMAIRPRALARAGRFDESLQGRGDEEEWQDRLRAAGGRVLYLAGAGLEHRRTAPDSRLWRLALADYRLGRSARRNDARKAQTPTLRRELRGLAGALWHLTYRRCAYGAVFAAHALGRIQETLAPGPTPAPADFLSGESGHISGVRATALARGRDLVGDAAGAVRAPALRRAGRDAPRRRVLVVSIERVDAPNLLKAALDELHTSRHSLVIATTTVGDRGKFENLNALLSEQPLDEFDWLLTLDDDVVLPRHFLDEFVLLAERFDFTLAQPAHRAFSHAAWSVTRRQPGSLARETGLVEIGPVTAFNRRAFQTLLPFPSLRFGWGLDAHWAAQARVAHWRIGVVDATPITHALRPVASSYTHAAAIAEARQFLAQRPYLPAREANRTLAVHRSL